MQPRPFLPSKDPLPIIVRDAYGINSPVFAYFVLVSRARPFTQYFSSYWVKGLARETNFVRGGVSCTRQIMVKVRFDGAPQKRDVIEMK